MSIDFSQVKTITIPEGSVTKITDSNGNILWKENIESWHTIWEGSRTITITKSGTNKPVVSGKVQNIAQTAIGTGTQPQLRITFSYSNTNTDPNWWTEFNINGSWKPESDVSSPVILKLTSLLGINICCFGCRHKDGDTTADVYIGLRKKFSLGTSNPNNNITINLEGYSSSNNTSYSGDFTLTFTVTKIEQYY